MIENALCLCCGVRYIREEFHAGCSEIKSNHDCIPEDITKWHNSSAYSEWVDTHPEYFVAPAACNAVRRAYEESK